MKFTCEIYPEHRVIFQRYEGKFTALELLRCNEQMWSDPRYSQTYDGIVDAASASFAIDIHDFQTFLSALKERHEASTGRWAAVTSSHLITALGFIYKQMMSHRHTFSVFSSWEAACEFINVPTESPVLAQSICIAGLRATGGSPVIKSPQI